jgi:hypothetical protein
MEHHSLSGESRGVSGASGDLSVERGLNEIRLALLALLVGIALTVGFGIDAALRIRLLCAASSFILTLCAIRNRTSRRSLMAFIHWILEGRP